MFLPGARARDTPPLARRPSSRASCRTVFFFLNVWKVSALVNVLYTVTINGTFQDLFLCLRAGLHSCLLHFARRVLQHILKNILKTFWFFFSGSQRPGTVYPSNRDHFQQQQQQQQRHALRARPLKTLRRRQGGAAPTISINISDKSIKKTSTHIKTLKRIWTNLT